MQEQKPFSKLRALNQLAGVIPGLLIHMVNKLYIKCSPFSRAKQILLHLEDLRNGNSVGSKAIACIEEVAIYIICIYT